MRARVKPTDAPERRTALDPVRPAHEAITSRREATVHEAKTHLSRLLDQVQAGETVTITRRGKPVAILSAISVSGPRPDRVPGSMKGMFTLDDRFFEPLPEDELRAWEGD